MGDQFNHEAILGMDGMVLAGIQHSFANEKLGLPDEARIILIRRRPPYWETIQAITVADQHLMSRWITQVKIRVCLFKAKLWVGPIQKRCRQ